MLERLCRLLKRTKKFHTRPQSNDHVIHWPSKQSEACKVPGHIPKPHYALPTSKSSLKSAFSKFSKSTLNAEIKDAETVERIRKSCLIGRRVLNHIRYVIKDGMSTADIDYIAHSLICDEQAYPSPLGYKGFPKSICTSVNNVVVHGIPDDRQLLCGDIINVDITVYCNGVHGDLSETFMIGDVDDSGKRLVSVTKECLDQAIKSCYPGQKFSEIGNIISDIASEHGCLVSPHFAGHGIGEDFHETPQILHHRNTFGGIMKSGMVFTIEPVLCEGTTAIKHWNDGWTVVSSDHQRSAQFEHTVLVNKNGVEVLTLDIPNDFYLNPSPVSLKRLRELLRERELEI